jgi:cyclic pyranopterin phosphate synthase
MTRRKRDDVGSGHLTHLDGGGRARMVDVGRKAPSLREAVAEGAITMSRRAFAAIRSGAVGKGDVLALARVAGIAAAKRTAELIPLCHTVPLDHVAVDVRLRARDRAVLVEALARARWVTGVEMEAMVAVAAALLTVYDMAKAVDRGMTLGPIRLLRKSGGRSGLYERRGRSRG